jgi:NADPH:quinone reductase-like Zn-dependent oxidoreductase
MKAIVCRQYGPPEFLQLAEVEKPVPGDDEDLVEVHASSVTWANLALVRGKPFAARLTGGGLLKPKYRIPGGDLAGRVEAVGRNVKQFKPGDEVFGGIVFQLLGYDVPILLFLPILPFEIAIGAWLLIKGIKEQQPATSPVRRTAVSE